MEATDRLLIGALAVVVFTFILSVTSCTVAQTKAVAGAEDPLAAACAAGTSSSACIVAASRCGESK